MREIDLTNYEVEVRSQSKLGQAILSAEKMKYDVRGSLIEVLFAPELGLKAREILDREDLARKIRDCPDNFLLLEDAGDGSEYSKLLKAVECAGGLGFYEIELIHRVVDAKKVEVQKSS